jgi:hypothetical protein
MKKLALAAAAIAAITAMPAKAAVYEFPGYWFVTAKAGTCNDYDPVGDRGVARYRYEIPSNPNREDQILTIFKQNNAQGYRLETGYFNSGWKVVDTIYVGGGWGPDDSVANVYLRVLTQTVVPAGSINANTQFINNTVQVVNYDYMPGCYATFTMSLQKRPQ